jgi:hypothetical protein
MRALTLFVAILAVCPVACKSHKPVAVSAQETADLPRESAVQKLGEILPTADYTYCTLPKWGLKPSAISSWAVQSDAVNITHGKGNTLRFAYADIRDVTVETSGSSYAVKVFTTIQTSDKEHYMFLWKSEEKAKQVAELLLSLRKR